MSFNRIRELRGIDVVPIRLESMNDFIAWILDSKLPEIEILNENLVQPLVFTYKSDTLFQIQFSSKDCIEIKMLYVRKEARGKNLAKQALNWICRACDEHFTNIFAYAGQCKVKESLIFSKEKWEKHLPHHSHIDYCWPIEDADNTSWANSLVKNHDFIIQRSEDKHIRLYRYAKNKRPLPPPPPPPIKDVWVCCRTRRISLVKPTSFGRWEKLI